MTIDSSTGPSVSIFVEQLPQKKSNKCTIRYGSIYADSENSSKIMGNGSEISYQFPPLIAGATYNYEISCSTQHFDLFEKLLIANGAFRAGKTLVTT